LSGKKGNWDGTKVGSILITGVGLGVTPWKKVFPRPSSAEGEERDCHDGWKKTKMPCEKNSYAPEKKRPNRILT